ncbi:putative transcription regulator Others family [Helianthus annuus]|uniref:Transcription regulator Others family n=1 Tax=Helianthus annuus TaxID=4232 RepID=A0A9K3EBT9_HELAN|nr:putative transcription regulator Others family [Helianthus annuus]KAJ0464603.1 putative transcription regulator Others family [Helianthus annuus]KAJ0469218.1 putative transcription regulator Others family [Helianthus annuus]KAJ0486201.1 putative transcription regulator Others family [Helianthus annuus]KAJ0656750.1 putative transcription regulator Others family [Helianthus annuus]
MTTGDGDRSTGLKHGPNHLPTDIHGFPGILLECKILTVSDAQQRLKSLREKLTPKEYLEFLDIMKDFREGRLDMLGVREKVIKLCETHQELFPLFNIYLPEREKITFPQAQMMLKRHPSLTLVN